MNLAQKVLTWMISNHQWSDRHVLLTDKLITPSVYNLEDFQIYKFLITQSQTQTTW